MTLARIIFAGSQHLRVYDVDRLAGGIRIDLVEDLGERDLVILARYVAEMGRADHVVHVEQRMAGVAQRLLLVDVDSRLAGPSRLERGDERAGLDPRRAAGVDD